MLNVLQIQKYIWRGTKPNTLCIWRSEHPLYTNCVQRMLRPLDVTIPDVKYWSFNHPLYVFHLCYGKIPSSSSFNIQRSTLPSYTISNQIKIHKNSYFKSSFLCLKDPYFIIYCSIFRITFDRSCKKSKGKVKSLSLVAIEKVFPSFGTFLWNFISV